MHYKIIGDIEPENEDHMSAFEAMPSDPDDTVFIEISSQGGDLLTLSRYLTKIIEAKAEKKKIVTYCAGMCISAAATLLWQGDVIYVAKPSVIMFHNSVDAVIHGPWVTLWLAILEKWQKFSTGKKYTYSTFSDKILRSYEPWDKILQAFGDKEIRGDYWMSGEELKMLAPDKVIIGIPDYRKLRTFGESPIMDDEDISDDVKEAIAEALESIKDQSEDEDDAYY